MIKRTYVKDFKIELVLTDELRCKLADILNGHTDVADISECTVRYARARRIESENQCAENVRFRKLSLQDVHLHVLPPVTTDVTV